MPTRESVLALGISLASEPAETALCFVGGRGRRPEVAAFVGLTDEELITACELPNRVAIDAPFGFARAFTQDVFAWAEEGSWPARRGERAPYRRATERFVETHTPLPLFLSERDNGAFVRCAGLLDAFAETGGGLDLVDGRAIEAYPPAALQRWGLGLEPYRGGGREENRATLLDRLDEAAGLHLAVEAKGVCVGNDRALDALVCALVACCADAGLTEAPPGHLVEEARCEGWIHLPVVGSLGRLGAGAADS